MKLKAKYVSLLAAIIVIAANSFLQAQVRFNKVSGYNSYDFYTSIVVTDTCYIAFGGKYDSVQLKYNRDFDWLNFDGERIKNVRLILPNITTYGMWYNTNFLYKGGFLTFTGLDDSTTTAEPNTSDILLCRFNSQGDTIWTKQYDSGQFDVGYAATESIDGGIIGAGYSGINNNSSYCNRIIKYDSLGNIQWDQTFNCGAFSGIGSIFQFPNGNICFGGQYQQTPLSYNKSRVTLIDSSGSLVWTKNLYGICDEYIAHVAPCADGNILVAGTRCFQQDNINSPPRNKLSLTKLNSTNGDTLWRRTYNTFRLSSDNFLAFARELPNGDIIAGGKGFEFYTVLQQTGDSLSNPVGVFIKTDANGNLLWKRYYYYNTLDSAQSQYIASGRPTLDGGYILCGRTTGWFSWDDGWLIKTDEYGCIQVGCQLTDNIDELEEDDFNLFIYPNPAQDHVSIDLPVTHNSAIVQFINMQGQLVKELPINGGGLQRIESGDLPNGVYQLLVSSKSQIIGREKLLIAR